MFVKKSVKWRHDPTQLKKKATAFSGKIKTSAQSHPYFGFSTVFISDSIRSFHSHVVTVVRPDKHITA